MKARYISPFTDFGFKKLFGEEGSREILIDFLNQLLTKYHKITSLTYLSSEQIKVIGTEKKYTFNFCCENNEGEKFIVQLQNAKHKFFKDRTAYFSSFPVQEVSENASCNDKISVVYCIGILGFIFKESEAPCAYLQIAKTDLEINFPLLENVTFMYIEMPNFNKKENELLDKKDKWLYFLKNLENFDHIPAILGEKIFDNAFQKAELAKLDTNEMFRYEESLKIYRDLNNVIDYARFEGKKEGVAKEREEGIQQRNIEVARDLKKNNISIEIIMKVTGLSREEIGEL